MLCLWLLLHVLFVFLQETQTELVLLTLLRLAEDLLLFMSVPAQRRREMVQELTSKTGELFGFFVRTLTTQNNLYQELVSVAFILFILCFLIVKWNNISLSFLKGDESFYRSLNLSWCPWKPDFSIAKNLYGKNVTSMVSQQDIAILRSSVPLRNVNTYESIFSLS